MKERLIFIYNPFQAKFMIQEIGGKDLYKIGKALKGDVCVSFYKTKEVEGAIDKWCNKNK